MKKDCYQYNEDIRITPPKFYIIKIIDADQFG